MTTRPSQHAAGVIQSHRLPTSGPGQQEWDAASTEVALPAVAIKNAPRRSQLDLFRLRPNTFMGIPAEAKRSTAQIDAARPNWIHPADPLQRARMRDAAYAARPWLLLAV